MSAIRVDGVSPAVPGHLVAGGGKRARASARGHGLAGARTGRHARLTRYSRRGDNSPAGCTIVAGRPSTGDVADQTLVRAALTTWHGPAWSASTRAARPGRCGCIRASRRRCAPTCRPDRTSSRPCWPTAEALLQAWPEADESQDTARDTSRPGRPRSFSAPLVSGPLVRHCETAPPRCSRPDSAAHRTRPRAAGSRTRSSAERAVEAGSPSRTVSAGG